MDKHIFPGLIFWMFFLGLKSKWGNIDVVVGKLTSNISWLGIHQAPITKLMKPYWVLSVVE